MSQKDMLDLFFEQNLFMVERMIYMGSAETNVEGEESGTDAAMAANVIKNLRILEHFSGDPITIIMNNCGGDVYHMLAIYDAIRNCACRISIEATGHVMSAGSIIFQAADERLLSPSATMLLHYGQAYFEGHPEEVARHASEVTRIRSLMEDIYLERMRVADPKYTRQRLRKFMARDRFLTATEAVALGLADAVIAPPERSPV